MLTKKQQKKIDEWSRVLIYIIDSLTNMTIQGNDKYIIPILREKFKQTIEAIKDADDYFKQLEALQIEYPNSRRRRKKELFDELIEAKHKRNRSVYLFLK